LPPLTTPVLSHDKRGCEREILSLAFLRESEEVVPHLARAAATLAETFPSSTVQRVQPIVDSDFIALPDRFPSEHLDTASQGIRIAGVIQIATGWQEDDRKISVNLAKVRPLIQR
jgi:hypothetical protein